MKKRLISLVFVVLLVLSMFVGCGGKGAKNNDADNTKDQTSNETPGTTQTADYGDTGGLKLPITTKDVRVTWMTSHPNVEFADSPLVKELKKRTGIYLEIQNVPGDVYQEKVNTSLASKQMPNIMNVGVAVANTYGEQGAFVALNNHYDLSLTLNQ